MSYTGRYVPTNPKKYKGNPTTIYYRSLWERKFMVYCDKNPRILEWGSEEIIIPYLLPTDGRVHRYFPDFYIKVKRADNKIRKMIIEVNQKNTQNHLKNLRKKLNRLLKMCMNGVEIKQNGNTQENIVEIETWTFLF